MKDILFLIGILIGLGWLFWFLFVDTPEARQTPSSSTPSRLKGVGSFLLRIGRRLFAESHHAAMRRKKKLLTAHAHPSSLLTPVPRFHVAYQGDEEVDIEQDDDDEEEDETPLLSTPHRSDEDEESDTPLVELDLGEDEAFYQERTDPELPIVAAPSGAERQNLLLVALKNNNGHLAQEQARICLEKVTALYEQHGKITQSVCCGKGEEQLLRGEWNLLLKREEGWFYQAGILTQDAAGTVVLAYPTEGEAEADLTEWITQEWQALREEAMEHV